MSEKFREILCVLIGHSKIVTTCFGYVYCARCENQLGDTLAGVYSMEEVVIKGHGCTDCQSNYKKLSFRDKIFVPGIKKVLEKQ